MPDVKHFDPEAVLDTVVELFWRRGAEPTGVQEIVSATGVNRSSLYATFGGKQELYLAALRRYVDRRSRPVLDRLGMDERGLTAVADFFAGLIEARCAGPYARWGCMVSNAHAGAENPDPEVRRVLDDHHSSLRGALSGALRRAQACGQVRPDADPDATADHLALLAYGVNLRSRAGADADALRAGVTAALRALSPLPAVAGDDAPGAGGRASG